MTYDEMLDEVRRRVGNISPAFNTKIPTWLTLGQQRIERAGNFTFLQADYSFSTVAKINGYSIPEDYKSPFSLRCITSGYKRRLEEIDVYDLEKDVTDLDYAGTASYFYFWVNKLYTYPVDSASRNYFFRYYKRLPSITASTESQLPEECHEAIVLYAVYLGYLEFEDSSSAINIKLDFFEALKDIKRSYLPISTAPKRMRY